MNIIRSITYGGNGNGSGNGLKWSVTSGSSFDAVMRYVNSKDPSIMEFFRSNGSNFITPDNHEVDFIHMMATLSGQYYHASDDLANLSGWAGDLQSLIYDVKKNGYGTGKNLNDLAFSLIGTSGTYFSMGDMIADVDARNISQIYSSDVSLSAMLSDYYSTNSSNRYSDFVNGYGGIENLEKLINSYTSGNGPIKHSILNDNAKSAAKIKDIDLKYVNSMVYSGYSYFDPYTGLGYTIPPIFSLPDPKKVTKEESAALTYAFIEFLKRGGK
jgi:hypothetical protein